jgi:hypothetical protein
MDHTKNFSDALAIDDQAVGLNLLIAAKIIAFAGFYSCMRK